MNLVSFNQVVIVFWSCYFLSLETERIETHFPIIEDKKYQGKQCTEHNLVSEDWKQWKILHFQKKDYNNSFNC